MKKKLIFLILFIFLLIPGNVVALSKDYVDKVSPIMQNETEEGKVSFYLFYGAECPHCEEEREWIKNTLEKEYGNYVNVYLFEVWHDQGNADAMALIAKEFGADLKGVPFTVIGDKYFVGYSKTSASRMLNEVKEYAELDSNDSINIPFLGDVDVKNVSLPIVAIILGFIDGFNPCAMWILLFLINLLFGMKDKKKSWILGLSFLFVSGFVYFLSMIGINLVLSIATINWMKILIAIFILIAGLLNLRKYLKMRKEEAGCTVVNDNKRKKIITRMKQIMNSKSFLLSLIGIIILATSVNLVELACSLGFPVIFTELLAINDIHGLMKLIYLLIYIVFYMIDDMVVFAVSMITLEATGITNKYNKLCTLISSIIMIIIGLLLIFKPDWLMLNF